MNKTLLDVSKVCICVWSRTSAQLHNRKNKSLVLGWVIFYFRQSYLRLLVLICAKISVCGFHVFSHHVISSPELFFFFYCHTQLFVSDV